MKILYAIQGTGNGHISRARDIVPLLQRYGAVDVLISGSQADVSLNFPVRYKLHGLCFIFGKRGGVDIIKTLKEVKIFRLLREIWGLDVGQYDLVINDFEPVSAWACLLKAKKCIGLSHQAAVIHPFSPKPDKADWLAYIILRFYAPASVAYGFHFKPCADKIHYPIIRQEVRALKVTEDNFYTVYLPAYSDDRIINVLSRLNPDFKVFSKHGSERKTVRNIEIIPISNDLYLQSLGSCKGVICGAGFEGPAEALFLKKKLLVTPMKGQYEQQCNAVALQKIGVKILPSLHVKHSSILDDFICSTEKVLVEYPDQTQEVIHTVIKENVKIDYSLTAGSFSFS